MQLKGTAARLAWEKLLLISSELGSVEDVDDSVDGRGRARPAEHEQRAGLAGWRRPGCSPSEPEEA